MFLFKRKKSKEGKTYVTCKICRKKFGSLSSHLHFIHDMSIYEYQKKFPNSKTICIESRVNSLFRPSKSSYELPKYKEYKKEHPCNTHEIINGIHDTEVNVYVVGDDFVMLCWFCAAKLGFFAKDKPQWLPDNYSESYINKENLLNYAKNNSDIEISSIVYNRGQFFSDKNNKIFFYRSGLELKHLLIMEKDNDIVKFENGPRITYEDYINEKGKRYYFVDWKLEHKDNSIKLVETKPLVLLKCGLDNGYTKESIIPKLESVEQYCKENNYEFEYWN